MNFKTPFKVLTTAALIGTLSLSAVAPGVSAATNNVSAKSETTQPTTKIDKIIITKDGKDYTVDRVLYNQLLEAEDALVKDATIKAVIAADGTYYTREAYSQALAATDSVKEAFAALEEIAKTNSAVLVETTPGSIEVGENGVELKDPTETPAEEDFKVTEIAAITDTVKKGEEQQLSFTVNGKEADLAKLKEAGYTVTFEYTIDDSTKYPTNGKVKADKSFEYRVVATPKEGKAVTSEWTKVSAIDATVATKVTGVELSNELTKVAVGETGVKLAVTKAENAFGEELKDLTAVTSAIESISSSDVLVATATKSGDITPRKAGKVTFTINFTKESKLAPVTLDVEITAAQAAASIKASDKKVEVNPNLDYLKDVVALDGNGEELRPSSAVTENAYTVVIKNAKGETVTNAAFAEAGKYTVTVSDKTTKKELGSYTIETVKAADALAIDEFKLTADKEFKIDVNPSKSTVTDSLLLEGFAAGAQLSDISGKLAADKSGASYELRSSDKKVLEVIKTDATTLTNDEVNVKGLKAGNATVSLVKVENKKETVLASYEVKVENTVELVDVTKVAYNEGLEAVVLTGEKNEDLEAAVVSSTTLTADQIESVELLEDGQLIVTIAPAYAEEGKDQVVLKSEKAAFATGKVTAAQYKALSGKEVTADQVKVLNKFFATTQEVTAQGETVLESGEEAGTKLDVTKAIVKTNVEKLLAATSVTATKHVHYYNNANYVRYEIPAASTFTFAAGSAIGLVNAEATKAWFQNGAKTLVDNEGLVTATNTNENGWLEEGTRAGGFTNFTDGNAAGMNVKKTEATTEQVVYVITGTNAAPVWNKVTLPAYATTDTLAAATK